MTGRALRCRERVAADFARIENIHVDVDIYNFREPAQPFHLVIDAVR